MKFTAVTFFTPTAPSTYSWEATNEAVAERYGVPIEEIVRFDMNTSPRPPERVARVLAGDRFETRLSEYPPSDYRRLVEAAAGRYGVATDEIMVGAGADEVLDLVGKAFLPAGSAAVVPIPTYSMFRVLTEQRSAQVRAVARRGADAGWALDPEAVREAARDAAVVWLCSPNNPTGTAEPDGSIASLLSAIAADAAERGGDAPIVVLDEAYAEFTGRSLIDLRAAYPRLIVVRTVSKAYAMAGLRVGFAIAQPEIIEALHVYRPPGSVSTVSVTVAADVLRDGTTAADNVARVEAERSRFRDALTAAGWQIGPSVTNFLLADLGTAERSAAAAESLLRRGLVPRTFGEGHPLATCLRITVRAADENDRFVAAVRAFEAGAIEAGAIEAGT